MTTPTTTLPTATAPDRRFELYWALSGSTVLIGRNVRHVLRSPEQLMLMLFLPIVLLLMFRYLFGGAIQVGSTTYGLDRGHGRGGFPDRVPPTG
jgi:ABC-2 type transport system permease protein